MAPGNFSRSRPMTTPRRWSRFSPRAICLAVVLLIASFAYVESYYLISRRGLRESSELQLEGFLNVPASEAAATENLTTHHRLARFYAPMNWLDRTFLNGRAPVQGIMWRIQ